MTKRWRWLLLTFLTIVVLDTTFDFAKWAVGRYTEVPLLLSIALLLTSSCLLALIVELIHRRRHRQEMLHEQYTHHNIMTWVHKGLRGKHRKHQMCADCSLFTPHQLNNCKVEQMIYELCVQKDIVIVIWECPDFVQKLPNSADSKAKF